MSDIPDTNANIHMVESLTAWGETISAQMRDKGSLLLHHMDGAQRSSEAGQPYVLPASDARLLRDLLKAATERGELRS